MERTNLSKVQMMARNSLSRATIREFDDKHLLQEISKADVMHNESPTNFERFQMVGLTSVPMKQKEEKEDQKNKESKNKDTSGDWDHNQPKGEAAEAIMLYMNGHRDHPIAMVDDRRVRPFNLKPGETSMYAASGTGQMMLHTDDGTYLVALNNKGYDTGSGEGGEGGGEGGEGGEGEEKERMVSIRHVTKDKQSREMKEGEEPEEHVHQGKPDQVNTEIQFTAKKINILDGETVIAVYDKEDKSWKFSGFNKLEIEVDEEIKVKAPTIELEATEEMRITAPTMLVEATDGPLEVKGKPINFNGGGPTIPPFTVPG